MQTAGCDPRTRKNSIGRHYSDSEAKTSARNKINGFLPVVKKM